MTTKQLKRAVKAKKSLIIWGTPFLVIVSWLFLHRLATLTPGLSNTELHAAREAVGWHGIYQHPFDLPLKLVRSMVFFCFPDHGQLLTRVPNVVFGALTVAAFAGVVRVWHGIRTALLATLLFACSAWVLHVSRLASFDVLYLWVMPTLLLISMLLHKYSERPAVWYGSLLLFGSLLYIPGIIWFVLLVIWLQREGIIAGWRRFDLGWQQLLSTVAIVVWLPLLIINLLRPGQLLQWLGFPSHFETAANMAKHFLAVPVHLFVRGPQYPEVWLDQAPLLDIFSLVACLLGIYFYARHWGATRSRLLATLFIISMVLIGLSGPVSLSLVVPLLYFAAAAGLAYLTREWLQVFPNNPLARGVGTGLIIAAVSLSCLYNVRAYFVAWPHTAVTRSTFHYRP